MEAPELASFGVCLPTREHRPTFGSGGIETRFRMYLDQPLQGMPRSVSVADALSARETESIAREIALRLAHDASLKAVSSFTNPTLNALMGPATDATGRLRYHGSGISCAGQQNFRGGRSERSVACRMYCSTHYEAGFHFDFSSVTPHHQFGRIDPASAMCVLNPCRFSVFQPLRVAPAGCVRVPAPAAAHDLRTPNRGPRTGAA
jgi:hypothetical protein